MKANKTAVIIESPFQALCALEALYAYPSEDVVFYTVEDINNTGKIKMLLDDFGYDINLIPKCSSIVQWFRCNYKREKYDNIIVGDIFSFVLLILTSIFTKYKSKVIYVDDGNSTLLIKAGMQPDRIHSFKWKLISSICFIKCIKRAFYTIYPIDNYGKIPVVHHSFKNIFGITDKTIQPNGVYIIGTNTSALNIDVKKYSLILSQISNYYSDQEKVYYCPHRRDKNRYNDYCIDNRLYLYDTQVSVEYDLLKNKSYPHVIIGFGSTALYTLRRLFPLSNIYNVYIELNNTREEESYRFIANFMGKEGIKNCSMDEWKR